MEANVKGSDAGDSRTPTFSLQHFFSEVFEKIRKLVAVGGEYEGYTPIIQGDRAGPHTEGTFETWAKAFCQLHGWHWRPQASQMPHANVLDLSIFPAMSKAHTRETRKKGRSVCTEEEIASAAKKVFNEYPSCNIARAFVQVRMIADRVIEHKGCNSFLATDLHFGIRKRYYDTTKGIQLVPDEPHYVSDSDSDA